MRSGIIILTFSNSVTSLIAMRGLKALYFLCLLCRVISFNSMRVRFVNKALGKIDSSTVNKWICRSLNTVRMTNNDFRGYKYSEKKSEAFTETIGRFVGWLSLFLNSPKRLEN